MATNRQIQKITIYQSRKPCAKTSKGIHSWRRKAEKQLTSYWRLSADKSVIQTPEGLCRECVCVCVYAHFFEFYFLELQQIPTVNIREKSAYASRRESIKGTILRYTRTSVLNKVCPQQELFNGSLTCWGFLRA